MGSSANSVQPAGRAGAVVGGVVVVGAAVVVAAAVVSGGAAARVREPEPAGLPITTTISVNESSASTTEPVPTTSARRLGSSSQSTAPRQAGAPGHVPAHARAARPAPGRVARPTTSPARPTVTGSTTEVAASTPPPVLAINGGVEVEGQPPAPGAPPPGVAPGGAAPPSVAPGAAAAPGAAPGAGTPPPDVPPSAIWRRRWRASAAGGRRSGVLSSSASISGASAPAFSGGRGLP